jgi:hypothetical protein
VTSDLLGLLALRLGILDGALRRPGQEAFTFRLGGAHSG